MTSELTSELTVAATTPFYRLRWLLRLMRKTELPAHHAAVVYALLARANGASSEAAAIPDGLMLHVPKQCRIRIEAGQQYAFSGTWIEPHPEMLQERLHALNRRLRALGRQREHRSADGLGGNFELQAVEDLVPGRGLDLGARPKAVTADHITREIRRLPPLEEVTLRFTSPLRLERPRGDVRDGHHFFGGEYFHAASFLHRLLRRPPAIGAVRRDAADETADELPQEAAACSPAAVSTAPPTRARAARMATSSMSDSVTLKSGPSETPPARPIFPIAGLLPRFPESFVR